MSRCPECGQKECCGASMSEEIDALKAALRDIAKHVGATVGEQCSVEFHCFVPKEVQLVVGALKAALQKYGDHFPTCGIDELCDCGWMETRRALLGEKGES